MIGMEYEEKVGVRELKSFCLFFFKRLSYLYFFFFFLFVYLRCTDKSIKLK